MSGTIYGVVTSDPITGRAMSLQADVEWNLGTAAVIAETVGGRVVSAERSEWTFVLQSQVDGALEASKQAALDVELRRMADGAKGEQA